MNFPRKQLVSVLHEAIEHTETHIRTSADVVGIETTENSVQVQLSDGSTEKGSILIGADGAWSRTRELMNELIATGAASASQNQKQRSCGSGEQPEAIFQCLYGSGRPPPSVEKRVFYEGHGNGLSTQFAVDDMGMHFALFKKMDKTRLDRRFTADETDAYRKEFANIKATPDLCWADVFEYVDWSRLVVQPEGETKQWFHGGRIVLVGDSAIQMTSNAGMGYNDSLQSAVFLVNSLCGLLREEAVPSEQSLTRIFAEYQKERQPQSSTAKMMSAWIARGNTWTSWSTKLFVEFVIPHVIGGKRYITMAGKSVVSKGRTLDGVSKEWKTGKIPWAY